MWAMRAMRAMKSVLVQHADNQPRRPSALDVSQFGMLAGVDDILPGTRSHQQARIVGPTELAQPGFQPHGAHLAVLADAQPFGNGYEFEGQELLLCSWHVEAIRVGSRGA